MSLTSKLTKKIFKSEETRFIAKKITKGNETQASILPTDQWLIKQLWNEYKTNSKFKTGIADIIRPAVVLGGSGALALGALIVAPFSPLIVFAGALCFATYWAVDLCPRRSAEVKTNIQKFENNIVPDLQKSLTTAYAKYKTLEFKNQWQNSFKKSLDKVRGKQPPEAQHNAPAANVVPVRQQLKTAFSFAKAGWKQKRAKKAAAKAANPKAPK